MVQPIIAGVDEAGRGPLAGPVIAAAVILDPQNPITGLTDSKKLSPIKRERLFDEIRQKALCWSFARANILEIDTLNILHASLLAMRRAIQRLSLSPQIALIDGTHAPSQLNCHTKTIIQGDLLEPAISAASIIAKVIRDRLMLKLDKIYPDYGFAQHKGYGTAQHLAALAKHGPTRIHRRSFAPVAKLLISEN